MPSHVQSVSTVMPHALSNFSGTKQRFLHRLHHSFEACLEANGCRRAEVSLVDGWRFTQGNRLHPQSLLLFQDFVEFCHQRDHSRWILLFGNQLAQFHPAFRLSPLSVPSVR